MLKLEYFVTLDYCCRSALESAAQHPAPPGAAAARLTVSTCHGIHNPRRVSKLLVNKIVYLTTSQIIEFLIDDVFVAQAPRRRHSLLSATLAAVSLRQRRAVAGEEVEEILRGPAPAPLIRPIQRHQLRTRPCQVNSADSPWTEMERACFLL